MRGTAAAASGVLTVTRTSSDPARQSSATCFVVAATSAVSVLVIDCTTTGASPPTRTLPTSTWRVLRRAAGPQASFMPALLGPLSRPDEPAPHRHPPPRPTPHPTPAETPTPPPAH